MKKESIKAEIRSLFSRVFLAVRKIRIPWKVTFIAMGVFSMFWVLFRVLSKPQRIDYPCVRAASPIMVSFLSWLFTMGGGIYFFNISKAAMRRKAVFLSIGLFLVASVLITFSTITGSSPTYASADSLISTNTPAGTPRGSIPGRVVWIWNPDATNENCTNNFGDAWDLPHNTNLIIVDSMIRESVRNLAGEENLQDAWNKLFLYFNDKKGKGLINYKDGEKIFIKVNLVGGHRARMDNNLKRIPHNRYANSQTSPQVVHSILRQLIDVCGISQNNIYVGDPSKSINSDYWDLWTSEFPHVNYVAKQGELGRITAESEPVASLKYSERGEILQFAEDNLCNQLAEADYLINLAALKAHSVAGVTLTAKNHYGSFTRGSASHLHIALPNETPGNSRYRPLVDMMAHEKLGGNTLLFVVDGLYPGPDANEKPDKWQMSPFNGDWASSIFVSQDPVALESVCFDFLATEYSLNNPDCSYPWLSGANDYLLQSADSAYWPEGFIYDPENDGTPISSLGVYERWNNPIDKQYANELGLGQGIDFVKLLYPDGYPQDPTNVDFLNETNFSVYPNPFQSGFTIHFKTISSPNTTIQLHNSAGSLVYQTDLDVYMDERVFVDAQHIESGLLHLTVTQNNNRSTVTVIKTQ
jgi:hypothetical protein